MLPTNQSLSTFVRLAVRQAAFRMTGRTAFSTTRPQAVKELNKDVECLCRQRDEPNPEYHHAPRCFVKNFQKYQQKDRGEEVQAIRFRNPRYRWADFRRRMVYGTYDV
ncbi:uncharacterized protein LOC108101467 [Drosophila ficusphila]|uniref:uncharacterized protein LOC108101467 n=1 Tax=Drosophila ficusphila TaxID=30025 RepID=UPI0007E817B9|nr:uncharacterized protein LOC108101467 [Drosophila ficusphila]